ncbi:alpha/beta hydrolase [Paenibacillus kribbensis]|uniref:Alpha/beta hydrolase n=1 Tax=Paenibacillus kribbensis TaxID=172713 RepID=A0A222WKN9_9BACL|nr:alpha/beta fold hydrolase [Paenibacillus kribbensis]ASR46373.1 alpha/beta hydrolase [Paenibacillus kribbensis]
MRRSTRRSYHSYGTRGPRKIWKILLGILIIIVLIAGWGAWKVFTPYQPDEKAVAALAEADDAVRVNEQEHWVGFEPAKRSGAGVILYPGALVKPESYAPLARRLAEKGHHVIIAKMPLNLPLASPDLAGEVLKAYPKEAFVIGGHSLGGVMAARYAAAHADQVKGVFFLASYPDSKGNLKDKNLPVISLLGSDDGVIDMDQVQSGRAYLPANTLYFTVEGGNHAQFGSYGAQKGDKAATISAIEQWNQTVSALQDWMKESVVDGAPKNQ